jgi:hypothetical protein
MFIDENHCKLPAGCKIILPTANKRKVKAVADSYLTAWFDMKVINEDPKAVINHTFLKENYNQEHI